MPNKERIFLGLLEVAGYYKGLKAGFQELGHPVTFVNLETHRFAYGGEDKVPFLGFIRWTGRKKGKLWRALNQLARLLLLFWAAYYHDVFIFACNTSFLKDHQDLKWLKRWGKTILFQYHGSDDRPPYLDGSAMAKDKNRTIETCIEMTRRKKQIIQTIEQFADVLISIAPQGILHERPFIQWLRLGLPIKPKYESQMLPLKNESNTTSNAKTSVIKILHCPSHPEAKGSDTIREVVQELAEEVKTEGLTLEFIEIVNQPNEKVCEALRDCDLAIDQLYADYGMASFATEAAWFGKPVIVGGYPAELWKTWLPSESLPPTVYIHPNTLKDTLKSLVLNSAMRLEIGDRLKRFVEEQWAPHLIAQRYLTVVRDQAPTDWWIDPQSIQYWQGCCLPEEKCRTLLGQVIALGGTKALCIDDKPELQAILEEEALKASIKPAEALEV